MANMFRIITDAGHSGFRVVGEKVVTGFDTKGESLTMCKVLKAGDVTPAAIYVNPKNVVAIIDEGPIEDEEQEE